MIFAAAPVRLAPNGGSLCRRDAGYSSFPRRNVPFTGLSYHIFAVCQGGFCKDTRFSPGRPYPGPNPIPAIGPARHSSGRCGWPGSRSPAHRDSMRAGSRHRWTPSGSCPLCRPGGRCPGVQGPGKGVPGLRIGEGDGIGGLRIQRRIGGDDHRPLRGGIWAVPEKGPEIQIGRLPGTVHGPAVGAGNGHMGQGGPACCGI